MSTPICPLDGFEDLTGPRTLVSPREAWERHGIKAGTVRQWAHRGMVHPAGLDGHDRALYDLDHLLRLAGML